MFTERKKGKHLTLNDRQRIEWLLLKNATKKEIAKDIGCSLATVYNEIKRSTYVHTKADLTEEVRYNPDGAQRRYEELKKKKGSVRKLVRCPELAAYIEDLICDQKYSPGAVLSEIRENGLSFSETIKSVNTIYSAISDGFFTRLTLEKLPQKRKQEYKRVVRVQKKPSAGTSIEHRAAEILYRNGFGHWEMDCVIGKKTNRKTILVLTERKTRYEIIEVLKNKNSDEVVKALNRIEKRYGRAFYDIFKTITVDNGTEFSDAKGMEKALYRKGNRTKMFYCHPYSSYERGSNENANRLVRRFFPKGTDFDKEINRNNIKDVEFWMNAYPRPMFNGKCANDYFKMEMLKIGLERAIA